MVDVAAEKQKLYAAVGEALSAWAEVESLLGAVFALCNNLDNQMPGLKGYWAVTTFDGKLSLSNAVIAAMLRGQPDLKKEWSALHNRLNEKNKNRNKLAHGQAIRIREGGVVKRVSFVPYHVANIIKEVAPGRREELSVKEIKEIASGFRTASARLYKLADALLKKKEARNTGKG